jgi:prevent-host-death family protein
MQSVNIAELRSHLSVYLGRARRGEEIVIRDRNLAIAKIVPLSKAGGFGEELLDLAAQGLVRLPEKALDWKAFFSLPAPDVPLEKIRAAIEAEREEE